MSDIIYGKNSVLEAINNDRALQIYLLEGHELFDLVKNKRIKYEIVDKKRLIKISNSQDNQGIVARVKEYEYYELEDILKKENGFIVMLDGISDVHNFGAIIRSCECAGVDGIIVKKHGNARINSTVVKVASGAMEYMKVVEVTNLTTTLNKLKEKGYWIYGAAGDGDLSYDEPDYKENIVLVLGSEGDGISRLVRKQCDHIISIPLKGKVNSLNASVATGILLYEVVEKREK